MKYTVMVEGQPIDMPAEVATDDERLKAALAPYFPGVSNSKIDRSQPVKNETTGEETVTVTVIKMAGTKGAPEAPFEIKNQKQIVKEWARSLIDLGVDEISQDHLETILGGIAEGMSKKLNEIFSFHPRAMKLIEKRKPFLVVAEDEPYYLKVYEMIRDEESGKGTWTHEDETRYQDAFNASIKKQ